MWNYECPASLVNLFFTLSSFLCLSNSFRPCIRDTPGRARNVLHPGAFLVPSRIWLRTNHTNLLNTDSLVCDFFVQVRGYFQANPQFDQSSFVAALVVEFRMPGWACQWKPFWIPVGESFKKAYLEEWIFTGDDSSDEQRVTTTQITYVMMILQHPDHRGSPILCLGNLLGNRIRPTLGNELRNHCLLYDLDATSSTKGSSVPFLSACSCPFRVMKFCQATKILSPQGQINLPLGSRWTFTMSWYITWLMFKKRPQTLARRQKGGLLHLLRQTVSAKIYLIVHMCRSGSASTTGTQGPDAERKMPSKNRLQAGGMSLLCGRQFSMSIMTFLLVCST